MRYFILLLTLLTVGQISAQRKPKIKGNKNVVDVQETLPAFSAIELNDDLEVHLQYGSEEGYEITADDNLIDVLKFRVEDSTLVISSFYNITGKKKLDITIQYNYVNAITVNDGKIILDGVLNSNELYVNTFGSSKIELTADSQLINVNMEGSSSGEFSLTGGEMSFVLKDKSDARIYTVSDLNNVKMYKNAGAKMEGTANELFADLMENSSLKGERLEAEKVFLNLQHSSSAEVNAINSLELTSNGSSKTHLYGSPAITILEFADSSELHKEK